MIKLLNTVQKILKDQAGGIMLMTAALLPVGAVLLGGTLDIARYHNANSKFQNACDSALLAAASVSRTQEPSEVASRFFDANVPAGYLDTIKLGEITVEVDKDNLQWKTKCTGQINTMFGSVIGFDSIPIEHEVRVAWDVAKRVEAVFTIDTSASMCMDVDRSDTDSGVTMIKYEPDHSCAKLDAMKRSMHYIIDNGLSVLKGIGGPAFYAGVVPFNHKVRFADPSKLPTAMTESEVAGGDPDYFTNFEDANPLSEVIPLMGINETTDKDKLKKLIDDISQSPLGRGWTRSNVAALAAAMMLDPEHYEAFGGDLPNVFNPEKTDKIVVMMTDGANIGCCWAEHGPDAYKNQYLYLYEADNAHLVGLDAMPEMREWAAKNKYNISEEGLCQQMHNAGITVYSVVYDVDDGDPGGEAIKDAYRACASSPQYFFDVKAGNDNLEKAYKMISQALLRLRIIY